MRQQRKTKSSKSNHAISVMADPAPSLPVGNASFFALPDTNRVEEPHGFSTVPEKRQGAVFKFR
jgi:hypothetical protein